MRCDIDLQLFRDSSSVKYGKNKDREHLSQIDLATLLVEESNLPFHYMKLEWNLPDIKTISELICEIYVLGYRKVKLVVDRGFCNADNINALYKDHYKILPGVPSTPKYARDFIY